MLHYSKIAHWLETRSWYRDNNVVHAVRSLISGSPARILELCCGTGILLEALSDILPTTNFVGVDISPGMVERAHARLAHRKNVRVLNQDWMYELTPGPDDAFDVVIVKNALHLLDHLPSKLKDLRRVCHRWTALIIIETVSPNADANDFIQRIFRIIDSEHLKQTFFTERTLTAALEDANWVMTRDRPTYVRQHIDTNDWLRQKCRDQSTLARATRLISETRNQRIRNAMDFDTGPGMLPPQMLRLQYVARHLFQPAFEMISESHNMPLRQLPLIDHGVEA